MTHLSVSRPADSPHRWIGLLIVGAVFCVIALALMIPYAQKMQQSHTYQGQTIRYSYQSSALQFAFTKDQVQRIFGQWSQPVADKQNGFTLNRGLLWPGDFLLPLGYGLLFLGLLMILAQGLPDPWWRRVLVWRWLPIFAMICDFAENTLMLQMLSWGETGNLGQMGAWVPFVTSLFSVGKYATASVLTPILGLFLLGFYWKQQPSPRRWTTVAFALFALLCCSVAFAFLVRSVMGLQ